MKLKEPRSSDYDGRPSVWKDYRQIDEYLDELVRVHGWGYATKLLDQDAAMRDAAEQAAKNNSRQSTSSMKEACDADFV
jgi:hypothetical protein